MMYIVLFIALLLFIVGLFRPQWKWPKWLAYVSLALAVLFGGLELAYPDPVLGVRNGQTGFMAAAVAILWAFPAICYAIGRFLRWVFIGRRRMEYGQH